jgi:glucosamine-6-phosphate deaminase
MKIEYFGDYSAMSARAAEIVAREIKTKDDFVLGLPTGSSPLGMYAKLVELNKAGKIDFSKVTTFNLDEYYPIKRENDQSYYKFMFDNFFGKININPENINIPNGEADDADVECQEYEKKIDISGGIDLMVIGIGANGHIGFNEPDEFLIPDTHVAVLTEETKESNKRFFNSIGEVPVKALTMGMGSILKAKKILMLVSGESKKDIFKKLLEGKINTQNPASFLYLHRDVTIVADIKI